MTSSKRSPRAIFETLRAHTVIGFLADPKHGGNCSLAGWRAVGDPVSRHHPGGNTPARKPGEARIRSVWGEGI